MENTEALPTAESTEEMPHVVYVYGDVETVGLKQPEAPATGIVQAAWTELDPLTLGVIKTFGGLYDPGMPIPEEATKIHGVTNEMVAGKPSVFSEFDYKNTHIVFIAHNCPFDFRWMAPGMPACVAKLCTLSLARKYFKYVQNHKLQTLADAFNLERGVAHSADGDVVTGISLLRHIVQVTGRTLPQLVSDSQKYQIVSRMPFGEHKDKLLADLPASYLHFLNRLQELEPGLKQGVQMQLQARGILK